MPRCNNRITAQGPCPALCVDVDYLRVSLMSSQSATAFPHMPPDLRSWCAEPHFSRLKVNGTSLCGYRALSSSQKERSYNSGTPAEFHTPQLVDGRAGHGCCSRPRIEAPAPRVVHSITTKRSGIVRARRYGLGGPDDKHGHSTSRRKRRMRPGMFFSCLAAFTSSKIVRVFKENGT